MDASALTGSFLGFAALIGGQLLQGGSLGQLFQFTAALVVLAGTAGAVWLSFSKEDVRAALQAIPLIYRKVDLMPAAERIIEEIFTVATFARKEGLLQLESIRGTIKDPIVGRGIKLLADGVDPANIREILSSEVAIAAAKEDRPAQVFETAGGYAPALGIAGAVLGLIQVVSVLNDPSKIGQGIAVAFVSTLYGVVLANLLLLPWASKARHMASQRAVLREIAKLGVFGIQEGLNPHFIREKLAVHASSLKGQGDAPANAAQAAAAKAATKL